MKILPQPQTMWSVEWASQNNRLIQQELQRLDVVEQRLATAETTLDGDLEAITALTGTGLLARTATDTWAVRTLTGPAAGISVSAGDGVSGNPTLALTNDLAAVEGLSSTGIVRRTATDTWSAGTTVSVAEGGTGATTASAARTALGLAIGTDVQAYSAGLTDISGLAKTDSNVIVGNGTNWVAESGATARASLGLTIGTDVQAYNAGLTDISGLLKTDGNIIVGNGTNWVAESGATARASLGLTIGTNVQAYNAGLTDISGLAKTDGNVIVGDGLNWVAESGSTARASLGLTIGTNVQAYNAGLADIAALAKTDGNIIVGNGTNWVAESGSTARASLGLAIGTNVQAWSANLDEYSAVNPSADALLLLADADVPRIGTSNTWTGSTNSFVGLSCSGAFSAGDATGDLHTVTGNWRSNAPGTFWSSTAHFYQIGAATAPIGYLGTQGSNRVSLVSNGYRNTSVQWTGYAAGGASGASAIELDPSGVIYFRTEASKADGSSLTITQRGAWNDTALTVEQGLTCKGSLTAGDSASDTHTINGTATVTADTVLGSDAADLVEIAGRVYGLNLHNNASGLSGASFIGSGTYSPTLTGVTNVAATTSRDAQYTRVGNVVTFSGNVDVDPTATGTTVCRISLPISSNFTAVNHAAGSGCANVGSTFVACFINADTTNDEIQVAFDATSTSNHAVSFTATYVVL